LNPRPRIELEDASDHWRSKVLGPDIKSPPESIEIIDI